MSEESCPFCGSKHETLERCRYECGSVMILHPSVFKQSTKCNIICRDLEAENKSLKANLDKAAKRIGELTGQCHSCIHEIELLQVRKELEELKGNIKTLDNACDYWISEAKKADKSDYTRSIELENGVFKDLVLDMKSQLRTAENERQCADERANKWHDKFKRMFDVISSQRRVDDAPVGTVASVGKDTMEGVEDVTFEIDFRSHRHNFSGDYKLLEVEE